MDIVDRRALRRELRRVEIVDLVRVRIEEIEDVELRVPMLAEAIADARIKERRWTRAHAAVLDERARPEIAKAQSAIPGTEILDRHLGRGDDLRRFGDIAAGMARLDILRPVIGIGEARAREGDGAVERKPR